VLIEKSTKRKSMGRERDNTIKEMRRTKYNIRKRMRRETIHLNYITTTKDKKMDDSC